MSERLYNAADILISDSRAGLPGWEWADFLRQCADELLRLNAIVPAKESA